MTVRMGAGYGCMPAKVEYNRNNGLSRGKLENGKEFENFRFVELIILENTPAHYHDISSKMDGCFMLKNRNINFCMCLPSVFQPHQALALRESRHASLHKGLPVHWQTVQRRQLP